MDMPKLKRLKITGNISVKPLPPKAKLRESSYRFIIMGPTGAGKSSFIEAFAGASQNLKISKDQLAGYTQGVTAYQLVNVLYYDLPIYLIDTPGFSDTRISELEIIELFRKWVKDNKLEYAHRILFLTPITSTRIAGSKRRTIDMLKALLQQSDGPGDISFVTTMWDTIHSERANGRAASNMAQLREGIFKGFVDKGALTCEFLNTTASALDILDMTYGNGGNVFTKGLSNAAPHLYQDLHERIEGVLQQKRLLQSELADPDVQSNTELKSILEQNHSENEETLAKFVRQLAGIREPPVGLEQAAQGLRMRIVAETTPMNSRYEKILKLWAEGADIPDDLFLEEPQSPPGSHQSKIQALKDILRRFRNFSFGNVAKRLNGFA